MGYKLLMTQVLEVPPVGGKWVRSPDGYIAGICEGLGPAIGVEARWIRLIWLVSVLCFGAGVLFYFLCWIAFPMRGSDPQAKKLLGVCVRLAESMGTEVGVVRLGALLVGLSSAGLVILVYVILHFALKETPTRLS